MHGLTNLKNKQSYRSSILVLYCTLQHVSADQISHHQAFLFRGQETSLPLYSFCVSGTYLIVADLDSRNMMQCDKIIYQICMVVFGRLVNTLFICLADHYVISVHVLQ